MLKCTRCHRLKADIFSARPGTSEGELVLYVCRRLPYWTTIGGLLRPGKGTQKASAECPVEIHACFVCGHAAKEYYGVDLMPICEKHSKQWREWLDANPERSARIHPKGRLNTLAWLEMFFTFRYEIREAKQIRRPSDG